MMRLLSLGLTAYAMAGMVVSTPVSEPDRDMPDMEFGPHLEPRQFGFGGGAGAGGGGGAGAGMDYNQNYKTGGNVQFSPANDGYSVNFSGAGDFVVGKGWRTGSTRNITYTGSTTHQAGTVIVAVYGWSRNPLAEYYIQDYTSDNKGSAQGQKLGTVESDGAIYDVWKHTQVNQPSIAGTATFTQYISNRRQYRPGGGTITTKNHFDAWAKMGMTLGQMDYQVLATEGWGNAAGNSKYVVTVENKPPAPVEVPKPVVTSSTSKVVVPTPVKPPSSATSASSSSSSVSSSSSSSSSICVCECACTSSSSTALATSPSGAGSPAVPIAAPSATGTT